MRTIRRNLMWPRLARRKLVRMTLAGVALGALLAVAGVPGLAGAEGRARVAPVLLEEGRMTQPWFIASFFNLREDLADATAKGKRFAIVWDQRGCPYCMEMQQVNLGDPDVNDYVRENFSVLQLDLFGSREVTDFDGEVLSEREFARKYAIAYTPTIQFLPESVDALAGKKGRAVEVARMPGYYRPFHFLALFEYVKERAYERGSFQSFVKAKTERAKAAGTEIRAY